MRHAMSEGIGFARACSRNDEEWRRALAAILDGATLFGVQSSQVGRGHRAEENRIRDPTSKHGLLDIVNRAPAALDCGTGAMTGFKREVPFIIPWCPEIRHLRSCVFRSFIVGSL